MSGRPDEDDDLEQLRQERLKELQEQQQAQADSEVNADAQAQEQAQQQAEAQKQAILRQLLTDGARKRLNSVKMSKPEFADQVENQIIQLAQTGRVQGKIDEDQMKQLLQELSPDSKRFDIRRG